MRDLIKLMFLPIVGCVAIALLFLLVVYGGMWESTVYNEEGTLGSAVEDLGAYDARIAFNGECSRSLYSPVCGDDGETYANACLAFKAGTKVSHRGQCGPR